MTDTDGKVKRWRAMSNDPALGIGAAWNALEEAADTAEALTARIAELERDAHRVPELERQRGELIGTVLAHKAALAAAITEAVEMVRFCAESHDAGRHDGKPEPCPANSDVAMWSYARAFLAKHASRDGDKP